MVRSISCFFLLLVVCSCSKPAVITPLTPAELQELQNGFTHLQNVLMIKAPFLQTNLAPPALDTEIAGLRSALNGRKIEVLEAWFRWHNGTTNLSMSLLPLGRPLSLAESLEDRKMIQGIPFVDRLRKNSIKILDDGAGDGFFLDVTAAKPLVFYHMLEDPTPRAYGTMTEFISFIASVFEKDAFFVNATNGFGYNREIYEALEAVHFKSLGKR